MTRASLLQCASPVIASTAFNKPLAHHRRDPEPESQNLGSEIRNGLMMTNKLPKYPLLTLGDKERIRAEIVATCAMVGDCWVYLGAVDKDGYGVKK